MTEASEAPEYVAWDELPPDVQREVLRRREEKANGTRRATVGVRFITPNAHQTEQYAPVSARRAFPGWLQVMPSLVEGAAHSTVRRCPGLLDYLGLGYMLPVWGDVTIRSTGELVNSVVHSPASGIGSFAPSQTPGMPKRQGASEFTLKFSSPWAMVTPPGWSTLILPWEFDRDSRFDVVPGVVDTDVYHQVSVIARWNANDDTEQVVKAGTPLAHLIPFQRTDLDTEFITDVELHRWYYTHNAGHQFKGGYRQAQRKVSAGCPIPSPPGVAAPVVEQA